MDEADSAAARAGPRLTVQQLGAADRGAMEARGNVIRGVGHVVQRLASLPKKLLDFRIGVEGRNEFDPALADGNHGDLNTLSFDPLAAGDAQPKPTFEYLDRRIEITNRDPNVIDPVQHCLDSTAGRREFHCTPT
jgi:hypothetical protein